jgi:hypothetical protein
MRRARSFVVVVVVFCSAGCPDAPGDEPPPALFVDGCPNPAALPRDLDGFVDDENADIAGLERDKDEASDTIGVVGGPFAVTTLDEDGAVSADVRLVGRKARGDNGDGLTPDAIAGEAVSFWALVDDAFDEVASAVTDDSGRYDVDVGTAPQPTFSILEGDGSCAAHGAFVYERGTKIVVTDIDGTLTTDDAELLTQIGDASYDPLQKGHATELLQAWSDKGYDVVYLSARPHAFRAETRGWLTAHGYPDGALLTANSLVFGDSAAAHKLAWLDRLRGDFGFDVVAAYGNADSDIAAYEDAGIAKDVTFIIGELAGDDGTVAIADDDYAAHIAGFVDLQPDD